MARQFKMTAEDQKAYDKYLKDFPMDCTWDTVFMAGREHGRRQLARELGDWLVAAGSRRNLPQQTRVVVFSAQPASVRKRIERLLAAGAVGRVGAVAPVGGRRKKTGKRK